MFTEWLKKYPITWTFQDHVDAGGISAVYPGVDFGMPEGDPIYAIESGFMVTAVDGSGANYIDLVGATGTWESVHLRDFVGGNRFVNEGDLIGHSGKTGYVTGAHYHLALIINGQRVDALPYLNLNTNMDTPEFVVDQDQSWGLSHIARAANLYPNDSNMWQNIANLNKTWKAADGTIKTHNGTWADMNGQLRVGDVIRTKSPAVVVINDDEIEKLKSQIEQIKKDNEVKLNEINKQNDAAQQTLKEAYDKKIEDKQNELSKVYKEQLALQEKAQKLEKEVEAYHQTRDIEFGLVSNVATTIVEETVAGSGLLTKYSNFIDNHFKSKTLRSLLKFDIFVLIGSALSGVSLIALFPNIDGRILTVGTIALGVIIKMLTTRYDSNKDGKLDINDTEVLKEFKTTKEMIK